MSESISLTKLTNFMQEYEKQASSLKFKNVAHLIAEDAIFYFSDGTFTGINEIQTAFEKTWALIEKEKYSIHNIKWIVHKEDIAVCLYSFTSEGIKKGANSLFHGRGTNVITKINGKWRMIHEHLSLDPEFKTH